MVIAVVARDGTAVVVVGDEAAAVACREEEPVNNRTPRQGIARVATTVTVTTTVSRTVWLMPVPSVAGIR